MPNWELVDEMVGGELVWAHLAGKVRLVLGLVERKFLAEAAEADRGIVARISFLRVCVGGHDLARERVDLRGSEQRAVCRRAHVRGIPQR